MYFDLTKGKISRALLLFALPMMAGDILQQLYNVVDTLIVGRGGGSNDDLKCFNEEDVVRAVASCSTPIITAVGHEIDKTLVDYVSDFASITPTDAGEKATLNRIDILSYLTDIRYQITRIVSANLDEKKNKLMLLLSSKSLINPLDYFSSSLKRVQELQKRGNNILLTKINELTNRLNKNDLVLRSIIENKMTRIDLLLKGNLMKLKALNPSSYIDKGYSLVTYQDNKILSSIDDIDIGEDILIQIKDGLLNASVTKKRRK